MQNNKTINIVRNDINKGIKETTFKRDYSDINLKMLDIMADRFDSNRFKYPKGNNKKHIEIDQLTWAMFRHIRKILQPIDEDDESLKEHLAAIACNVSMIIDQLELQNNPKN